MVDRARRAVRGIAGASLLLVALLAPTAAQAATNNIFTVAGTTAGLSGDDGLATAAQLWAPTAVAVTSDGGYLIAEITNDRIRRVSASGMITTVAGTIAGLSRATAGLRPRRRSATRSAIAATARRRLPHRRHR